jgi:hypothetical protein
MAKQDNVSDAPNGTSAQPADPLADANKAPTSSAPGSQAQGGAEAGKQTIDAIELLKADHRKVEALFSKYEGATSGKKEIVRQICAELTVHTALEEEIFYPACRRAASDEEPLDEAQVEHDSAKVLISDLMNSSGRDRFRDAKVSVLREQIKHHVGEEEAPSTGIFAKAQAAGVDTQELGSRLQARKHALMAEVDDLMPSRPVSFQVSQFQPGQKKEDTMASYRSSERDRDERGRFMDDDDRGRGRGSRDRDDEGRYSSRGSSRDDDDRRGWHGDPEGHAEASRRGWDERRGGESRSFRQDDDDRRYSSRGYDRDRDERGRFADEDDRGYSSRGNDRDRDERGRFTDEDGRGYSSRGNDRDERGRFADDDRRYSARGPDRDRDERGRFSDDDDRGGRGRGQGGWFGDSRGHAEAARRGWEDRDEGRSRNRDDDDDRGGRGGRGQGGWFGDARGHAEAARRGWQDRH